MDVDSQTMDMTTTNMSLSFNHDVVTGIVFFDKICYNLGKGV